MPGEEETTVSLPLFRISSRPCNTRARPTSGVQPAVVVAPCGAAEACDIVTALVAHHMTDDTKRTSTSRRLAVRCCTRGLFLLLLAALDIGAAFLRTVSRCGRPALSINPSPNLRSAPVRQGLVIPGQSH